MPASVIRNLPAEQYHAIKAVSAGMVWTIDSECPMKAWLGSPWNPALEHEDATHFDIGTAVHLAVLEPHLFGERIALHGFDDYKTKDARLARDDAYAAGKTPLKPAENQIVLGMREALARRKDIWRLFADGDSEITLQWEWNGLPCKARPDFLAADGSYILDLKSAITVNPKALARKLENEGWFVRAPWYMDGARMATGVMPTTYKFVVVEKEPPHLCEVLDIDIRALVQGEQIIGRALPIIAECQKSGHWPSYGNGQTITLNRPTWAEYSHADRDAAGDFR